jgi:hypothetical protein
MILANSSLNVRVVADLTIKSQATALQVYEIWGCMSLCLLCATQNVHSKCLYMKMLLLSTLL